MVILVIWSFGHLVKMIFGLGLFFNNNIIYILYYYLIMEIPKRK